MPFSRNLRSKLLPLLLLSLSISCSHPTNNDYVNPFIGTQDEGHCFPGAARPMSLVQVSPESADNYYKGYEGRHVVGYQYNDPWITGFTQTHMNGVGCPSLSDILMQPFSGREIGQNATESLKSAYDKSSEVAAPGYYSVYLKDNKVKAELTAAPHTSMQKYTYEVAADARLLIDLQYGVKWDINSVKDNILEAEEEFTDPYTLKGYRHAQEWTSRKLFYMVKFNHPISNVEKLAPQHSDEKARRYLLTFDLEGDNRLIVKTALSTTSVEGAEANMQAEVPDFDFEAVRQAAAESWRTLLDQFECEGTREQKTAFYTALYHLYLQPNNMADIDGRYRGEDDSIHTAASKIHHTTFSLWDTYRAAHPLYTITIPETVDDFVNSLMQSYTDKPTDADNPREANKYLPRWGLWGKEVHTMIGNHAVPVIVDAYLKGLVDTSRYSANEIFDAVWNSVTLPHYRNHTQLIDRYGHIPIDVKMSDIDDGREIVSRLLEGIYDDYCAARMAKTLARDKEAAFLRNRSRYYTNVYDPTSGFMRGRHADGRFRENVNPSEIVGEWMESSDFTEGSAWHYTFHVQHDVEGMIQLMGGEEAFTAKLDSLFSLETPVRDEVMNLKGNIGQYSHGNEPSHHVAYLYKYTRDGYKTDSLVRHITSTFYPVTADGLVGNDDCGQMSAWYIFSSMGFYPVNPCGGEYVLGAPQMPGIRIRLSNGKYFTMKAHHLSPKNIYVKSVRLNGRPYEQITLHHDDIMAGGTLEFEMTDTPVRR